MPTLLSIGSLLLEVSQNSIPSSLNAHCVNKRCLMWERPATHDGPTFYYRPRFMEVVINLPNGHKFFMLRLVQPSFNGLCFLQLFEGQNYRTAEGMEWENFSCSWTSGSRSVDGTGFLSTFCICVCWCSCAVADRDLKNMLGVWVWKTGSWREGESCREVGKSWWTASQGKGEAVVGWAKES